ncbi:HET-domain-containing protein [Xylaria sp. FL0043]|nr:HET-domain-containing protein [Xylaria sp. FL0043]
MAADAAGRTIWNDKTRSDLLQAIVDVAPPTAQQWDAISAKLRAKGYTYNYSAALQHLQKLKKKEAGNSGGASGASSVPATPKKNKSTPSKAKTPTSGNRKRQAALDRDEDEDELFSKKKLKSELGVHVPENISNGINFEIAILGLDKRLRRFGYWKILKTCLQARKDGLNYLWVDTNCIDKTSSAELSEAINSMYSWYYSSSICYAYLSDVQITDLNSFRQSRWFRRGWTLQELLAPRTVRFYSSDWTPIGTKNHLASLLANITRVDEKYLLYAEDIRSASVAQRMAAVADRTTTRPEDIAYCLLGLFNVNMPLLYGEGAMAFVRLQEEIMRVSDDHSLFAWTWISELTGKITTEAVTARRARGHPSLRHKPNFPVHRVDVLLRNRMRRDISRPTLLALDPACFFDASTVPILKPPRSSGIFTMTNAGLSISLPIVRHADKKLFFAVIHEETNSENDTRTAVLIPLMRHYRHQDRWTRTSFPVAPITVVFRDQRNVFLKPETIQVCRDVQHVSFYFDAFGGTSHRFGFWLFLPQLQEEGHVELRLEGGCVTGDGVYNSHGVFMNPEEGQRDQFMGGLLILRVEAGMQDMWQCWHDKTIVLFLALRVEMSDGHSRKTSQYCRILILPQVPVDAPQLLAKFLTYLQKHDDGGQSTHMCNGSFKQKPRDAKRYSPLGHQEVTLQASVELLNDGPLSHSPQSQITLTKLSFWHPEKRERNFRGLGRGFTI